MNGSRTFRPRKIIRMMNSGKPHWLMNLRDGAFSPNHVSRRLARAPIERPGSGDVVDDDGAAPVTVGPLSTGRGIPSDGGGVEPDGGSSSVLIRRRVYQNSYVVIVGPTHNYYLG